MERELDCQSAPPHSPAPGMQARSPLAPAAQPCSARPWCIEYWAETFGLGVQKASHRRLSALPIAVWCSTNTIKKSAAAVSGAGHESEIYSATAVPTNQGLSLHPFAVGLDPSCRHIQSLVRVHARGLW